MASGDSLLFWTALHNEAPDADYATIDAILTTSADEPDDILHVLDFDPGATNEFAVFPGVLPAHYDGGGVTVTLIWVSSATSGNVKWDIAFKRHADTTNLLSKAYAAALSTTTGTDATARDINTTTRAFTHGAQMDSIAVGEYFRLAVERDSADAGDTMNSNDAELIAVYLKET